MTSLSRVDIVYGYEGMDDAEMKAAVAAGAKGIVARNGEANDDQEDLVVADTLNAQKARILLRLALTRTRGALEIQNCDGRFGYSPRPLISRTRITITATTSSR
jgi:L-asparaginase/Glu-tRNA(Gln) amidotransferase subunit D